MINIDLADSRKPIFLLFGLGICTVALVVVVEFFIFGNIRIEFDPWSLLGISAAQFLFDRQRVAVNLSLAIGLLLTVLIIHLFPSVAFHSVAFGLSIGSAVVLIPRFLQKRERGNVAYIMAAGLLFPIAHQVCIFAQRLTTLDLNTFDNRAYLMDTSFGVDPEKFFRSFNYYGIIPIEYITAFTYVSITFVLALVILLKLKKSEKGWILAMSSFVLAGIIGAFLYQVFPITGPHYAFLSHLPDRSHLSPAAAFVNQEYVRNGMPSLHTAWAFLIVLNAIGLSRTFRAFTFAYFGFTILATLALGEHYVIDLIVALPFAIFVQSSVQMALYRHNLKLFLCIGFMLTAIWFIFITKFDEIIINNNYVTAALVIVTLVGAAWCAVKLAVALESEYRKGEVGATRPTHGVVVVQERI